MRGDTVRNGVGTESSMIDVQTGDPSSPGSPFETIYSNCTDSMPISICYTQRDMHFHIVYIR